MSSPKYRYLIRPDGTIRVISKNVVRALETDTLVCLTQYYAPERHFWDSTNSQMAAYTPEQEAERRLAKQEAQAVEDIDREAQRQRLKRVLKALSPDQREAIEIVADLAGIDLN